jgi:hypothetical protein
MPKFEYWYSDFNWVTGLAFLFALLLSFSEVKEHLAKKNIYRALLSIATTITIAFAWWASAVHSASNINRSSFAKVKTEISSILKIDNEQSLSVFINHNGQSLWYVKQWIDIFSQNGWEVIGTPFSGAATLSQNEYNVSIKESLYPTWKNRFKKAFERLNQANPEIDILIDTMPNDSNGDISITINMVE